MGLFRSLITKILDRLLPSKLAIAEKTEITEMLVDMQKRVEQGTSKIDEQIPVLQKILKDIDRIEEGAPQSTLDTKLIDLSKRTGASPEEARKALVDAANEAYPPGSSKTMKIDDDATLEAYIDTREQMGMKIDLLEDIIDRVDPPPSVKKDIEKISLENKSIPDQMDEALKANKQRQTDLKALEDKMADIKNFKKMTQPGGLEKLMKEVQDDKVIDLAKFRKSKDPVDDLAMGGRVGMNPGGLAGIAKMLMSIMRKGDEKQIKGVIRDPKTDLERLKDTDPKQPTIRDMEDLPGKLGYDKRNTMKLEELVEREKVRAILADRMGVDPKEISEVDIDMAIREGMGMFSKGGGVGSLFRRK
tara:strand:- start:1107 stop:2186 length:1080 start_codon:yes stop_codon:yes gene_type:complete